jgi:hypothetical protein
MGMFILNQAISSQCMELRGVEDWREPSIDRTAGKTCALRSLKHHFMVIIVNRQGCILLTLPNCYLYDGRNCRISDITAISNWASADRYVLCTKPSHAIFI